MHLIFLFCLYIIFFFLLFTGAHRRKALQMLILRSKIQAIVPCATTHKTSYWYKKNFCDTKILCDFSELKLVLLGYANFSSLNIVLTYFSEYQNELMI